MVARKVTEYEIIERGIDNPSYFSGYGTAFTRFEESYTGIGDTPQEALQDALNFAAESDWDVEHINEQLADGPSVTKEMGEDAGDCYYFVTLLVRG